MLKITVDKYFKEHKIRRFTHWFDYVYFLNRHENWNYITNCTIKIFIHLRRVERKLFTKIQNCFWVNIKQSFGLLYENQPVLIAIFLLCFVPYTLKVNISYVFNVFDCSRTVTFQIKPETFFALASYVSGVDYIIVRENLYQKLTPHFISNKKVTPNAPTSGVAGFSKSISGLIRMLVWVSFEIITAKRLIVKKKQTKQIQNIVSLRSRSVRFTFWLRFRFARFKRPHLSSGGL